jgi:hypothetical protein
MLFAALPPVPQKPFMSRARALVRVPPPTCIAGLAGRAVFGAYLGVVMTHFIADAGLWRMRARFPRQFLAQCHLA